MNHRKYPFHESLKLEISKIDSPLWAMRLVRQICFGLDCSTSEVELIIAMAPYSISYNIDDIYKLMPHLSTNTVDKMVRKLVNIKAFHKNMSENNSHTYKLEEQVKVLLKQLDKTSLIGK